MWLWLLCVLLLLFPELFELLAMAEVFVYHCLEALKCLAGIYVYDWIDAPSYLKFGKVQSMLVFM